MKQLDLALLGNSRIGVLVDGVGTIVWGCFPRLDSDATFCALLAGEQTEPSQGFWSVELEDLASHRQRYVPNTPVLVTHLTDTRGGELEITDFAPRFQQFGRNFCPMMLIRRIRRVTGHPRMRTRLRPAQGWGSAPATVTQGSHHLRYVTPEIVLRLTTDASITAVLQEESFLVNDEVNFILGADETLQDRVAFIADRFLRESLLYWQEWVRNLAIPFEWQEAVIRAAITLKLNTFEDSGAIIAAVTTSIPEAAGSQRNWDYRYCWLRDAYFVINALNRLSATGTMERYLSFIQNIAIGSTEAHLKPVYRIDGRTDLDEFVVTSLPGYRDMGPVRVGNQAHQQIQNDVYGSVVLASTHVFFDQRLHRGGQLELFQRLETWGEQAERRYDTPDAGLWELRGAARVHTFSSIMCWVACDRLARIATRLGLPDRASHWRTTADTLRACILQRAWNDRLGSFVSAFEGSAVDASLLLLPELRFISARDPRFIATVARITQELRIGDFIFRYREADDFGMPQNAFVVCTFWYIDALASIGRRAEARELFENMLACRNSHGFLAEHIQTDTREFWGNYVQTYSMVGLVNSAVRLSIPWEEAF